MTKSTATKQTAQDAFIGKTAKVTEMLAIITDHIENHCETHPDQVNWGHVGTLGHVAPAPKPARWSLPEPTGQVLDRRI